MIYYTHIGFSEQHRDSAQSGCSKATLQRGGLHILGIEDIGSSVLGFRVSPAEKVRV